MFILGRYIKRERERERERLLLNPLRLLDVPGTLPPGGGTRAPHPSGKLNAGSMAQRELLVAAFDQILPLSSGIKRPAPAMPMFRHAYHAYARADNRSVCVALE